MTTTASGEIHGDAIVDRLKKALNAQSDGRLAVTLGVTAATVSGWRRRDTRPYAICIDVAQQFGISLDWLLTGTGPMHRAEGAAPNDGCQDEAGPYEVTGEPPGPPDSADFARRIEALSGLLAALDPESRDAILGDCLSRATAAQQLAALTAAVAALEGRHVA